MVRGHCIQKRHASWVLLTSDPGIEIVSKTDRALGCRDVNPMQVKPEAAVTIHAAPGVGAHLVAVGSRV
jgi:hypothetical protein